MSIIICLFSIKIYSYWTPLRDTKDDLLQELAQWQLFFVLFTAQTSAAVAAQRLKVGEAVDARINGTDYHPGRVAAVLEDDTYRIEFTVDGRGTTSTTGSGEASSAPDAMDIARHLIFAERSKGSAAAPTAAPPRRGSARALSRPRPGPRRRRWRSRAS